MATVTTNTPSTPAPVPSGSGVGSGPPDPKAELDRLRGLLQENQAKIDQMSKASSAYQQDITVLESGLAEVDQVVKAYAQGVQALGDPASLRTFVDQKGSMAVAAVGTGKADLDAIVARYDADAQTQSKSLADLQAARAQALSAQETALRTANDKQAAYNAAKASLSRVQAGVASIKNLQKQIGSAADSGNFGSMYLLVGEMRSALDALAIPSPADLQTQLATALLELKAALQDTREKKVALDQATAAVAVAQQKLDNSRASRLASLLDAVKNWKPPAQPAPQQGPPPTLRPAPPSA
jgi:DNA repair exonuclease SbcCD ATPase subunit